MSNFGDGWKHMPPNQPRFCVSCGNTLRITKDLCWFDTYKHKSYCRDCWPRTITFQPCGCAYCMTVEAAIDDAKDAHRAA